MNNDNQGQTSKDTFVDEMVTYAFPNLEALADMPVSKRKIGHLDIRGYKDMGRDIFLCAIERYPDSSVKDSDKKYNSAYSALGRLKKELKKKGSEDLKNPQSIYKYQVVVGNLIKVVTDLMSPYRKNSNKDYIRRKLDRATTDHRVELDMTDYILKAEEVLSKPENWTDVSCAIALATGRRMSEVHLSGEFEVSGEYELIFKGQLKGKSRRIGKDSKHKGVALINHPFTIPTIVKAQLVVDGIQYLEDYKYFGKSQPKRLDKSLDTVLVNRTYSKALSSAVKDRWHFAGEDTTYHLFRAAYLRLNLVRECIDPFDYLNYARTIVGDDDSATLEAYQRYHIKPDTLTRA